LIFLGAHYSIGQENQENIVGLEYQSGIKLDSIIYPGGKRIFKQFCTTEIDSVIRSGNISFKESSVGAISNCIFQYQIRNDTLASIMISTDNKINTRAALKQGELQFGEPEIIHGMENEVTYTWEFIGIAGKITYARLFTMKNGKKGVMSVLVIR